MPQLSMVNGGGGPICLSYHKRNPSILTILVYFVRCTFIADLANNKKDREAKTFWLVKISTLPVQFVSLHCGNCYVMLRP